MAYADRLVAGLAADARAVWDDLRIARVLGAHAEAASRTEYLDDPWPLGCLEGCTPGCAAGWYAVREPLLLGAALALLLSCCLAPLRIATTAAVSLTPATARMVSRKSGCPHNCPRRPLSAEWYYKP